MINIYSNKSIYSINYPNGKNVVVSYAQSPKFNEIYNNILQHKCSTLSGSSGAPILLIESQKVIGIHLSAGIQNLNIGSLIIYSIIEFQQIENNIFNNDNLTANYVDLYNNIRMLNKNEFLKKPISPMNNNNMKINFNINNFYENNKNDMNDYQTYKNFNPKTAINFYKNKQIKAIINNKNQISINNQNQINMNNQNLINSNNEIHINMNMNMNNKNPIIINNQNQIDMNNQNQIDINNKNQINMNNQNQINMNNQNLISANNQNQINMNNQILFSANNQNQFNMNNQNQININQNQFNMNNQNQINMNNQNLFNTNNQNQININQNKFDINNQNRININNQTQNNMFNNFSTNLIYLFPKKGLSNIGNNHMNATLQCLLHTSELNAYFLNTYSNDKNNLNEKNKSIVSYGQVSNAYYELVKGVCENEFKSKNSNPSNTSIKIDTQPFSPKNFKRILSNCNSQFKQFDFNTAKDLILYLMQTIHEELNYFGDSPSSNLSRPNQYNRENTFMFFMNSYNSHNYSIISNIFYGTYEDKTLCKKCNIVLYNFHKFEFVSFKTLYYKNKIFNIYNGFEDNSKPRQLMGENKFYCNNCKNLADAELTTKIILPPNKLLINIDYGKNNAFKPSKVKFDETIDLTKYISFDFGAPIRYILIGVCTYLSFSGSYGQYNAYCKNKETGEWYNFNDSICKICNKKDIYMGSPYLLLYEKI